MNESMHSREIGMFVLLPLGTFDGTTVVHFQLRSVKIAF
jgi:hypothetical protein